MDIESKPGFGILTDAERTVLEPKETTHPLPESYPLEERPLLGLELLVRERLLDKQSRLDELRAEGSTVENDPNVFRLRRELGTLHQLNDQLFGLFISGKIPPSPDDAS